MQIPFLHGETLYYVAKARDPSLVTDFFPYYGDHVRGYESPNYHPHVISFIEQHL
jgi:hypothetical protein